MVLMRWAVAAAMAVAISVPVQAGPPAAAPGPGGAKEAAAPSPDQQVKELAEKYLALPGKAQGGAEGARLIEQLKAVRGPLSPQSREQVARLITQHNLRQLVLKVHDAADAGKPGSGGVWVPYLLPYVEQRPLLQWEYRTQWEYRMEYEGAVRKLGKDDVAAGLNRLGQDGWELVTVDQVQAGAGASAVRVPRYFFKRPKRAAPAPTAPAPGR
jgi:hypothetical protein